MDGLYAGSGVDGYACFHAHVARLSDGEVEMRGGFLMDDDAVGAGVFELVEVAFGALYHHVDFEGEARYGPDGFDDDGAEGDGWDEVAVHDVYVEAVGACAFGFGDLLTEAGEVG